MIRSAKARAYANIALIKYWGKRDEELVLPMNSSLSLTLDCFYSETQVIFNDNLRQDYFYLNHVEQDQVAREKVSKFLDLFRKASQIKTRALVKSINYLPTAAGLASSASGLAALAAACNVASGLNLNHRELSMYARQGSGSATRSIYGGFVEWQKGSSEKDSYGLEIDDASWDIGMVIVVVNSEEKTISSRDGMKLTVETSPFYPSWVKSAEEDLKNIKVAIKNRDFEKMGMIAESNGLKMHASMLGANPPLSYWQPESVLVMQIVRDLRSQGIMCYFTMDAGPNVKIICRLSQTNIIKSRLEKSFNPEQIIVSGPGPGITIL